MNAVITVFVEIPPLCIAIFQSSDFRRWQKSQLPYDNSKNCCGIWPKIGNWDFQGVGTKEFLLRISGRFREKLRCSCIFAHLLRGVLGCKIPKVRIVHFWPKIVTLFPADTSRSALFCNCEHTNCAKMALHNGVVPAQSWLMTPVVNKQPKVGSSPVSSKHSSRTLRVTRTAVEC